MMYVKIASHQDASMCGFFHTNILQSHQKIGSCNGVGGRVRSSVDT